MNGREVLSEIHYCVLCHERDKDSCSKGLRDKDGKVSINPLGIELGGCPLGEKISEMHTLRKAGDAIAALALVAIDNPMCPGTGHRICNDCMKSCIYQKQEPVNISLYFFVAPVYIETSRHVSGGGGGGCWNYVARCVGVRDLATVDAMEPR
jgi:NADPH-dependent glutamate synthase beta subunit-like oxidoreductase